MPKYNEYILPLSEAENNISPGTMKQIAQITKSVKRRDYSIQNLIDAFQGYSKVIKQEPIKKESYKEIRSWILKNLALVLDGDNIDPLYDIIGNVEDIMEEYQALIGGLIKMQKWCKTPYDKIEKIEKISTYMEEFLKIDSFLKVITESRHNIVDFINSDVQDQNATDLEAESIDSIERNIKKWEAVSAFPSTTFPSTTFPSEFPSTLPMIYH